MRTTLFLSTLFAVSLVGGAALAEKSAQERPARQPRAIEILRAHGDTVDKSYRGSDRVLRHDRSGEQTSAKTRQASMPNDRSSSRINCSDTGADCGGHARSTRAPTSSSSLAPQQRTSKSPLTKPGNDRMKCNEADECGVSSKGAKKTWAASSGASSPTEKSLPALQGGQDARRSMEAGEDRMVCNEADECMMSSKAAGKIWAKESVKAGTWHGAQANDTATEQRAQQSKERQQQATQEKDQQAKQQREAQDTQR